MLEPRFSTIIKYSIKIFSYFVLIFTIINIIIFWDTFVQIFSGSDINAIKLYAREDTIILVNILKQLFPFIN